MELKNKLEIGDVCIWNKHYPRLVIIAKLTDDTNIAYVRNLGEKETMRDYIYVYLSDLVSTKDFTDLDWIMYNILGQ